MLEQRLLGVVDVLHGNGRFSGGSSSSGLRLRERQLRLGRRFGDRRHRVGLADFGLAGLRIIGIGGMEPHDALILLAPALFHLLELGLADHILDAGCEVPGHPARSSDPITYGAHDLGQVLRPDKHERQDRDDDELSRIDAEHYCPFGL